MKNRVLVLLACAIFAGLGLFGLVHAIMYFPFGRLSAPGPGAFSAAVFAILTLAAGGAAFEAVRRPLGETLDLPSLQALWRPFCIVGALSIGALVLEFLGFAWTGTGVALALLALFDPGRPLRNLVIAVSLGVGSHYLFVVALGVPLPRGMVSFP